MVPGVVCGLRAGNNRWVLSTRWIVIHAFPLVPGDHVTHFKDSDSSHILSLSVSLTPTETTLLLKIHTRRNLYGSNRLVSSPQANRNTLLQQIIPMAQKLSPRSGPKASPTPECSTFEQPKTAESILLSSSESRNILVSTSLVLLPLWYSESDACWVKI